MNTAEQILVIILAATLAVFLILAIVAVIMLIRLIKSAQNVANKAESFVDTAEMMVQTVKQTADSMSFFQMFRSVAKMMTKSRK